jgi:hypothetical protein
VNDVSAITQAGVAGLALFILFMLVRLASNGTLLFGAGVEREREAYQGRIEADARRIEALETLIRQLQVSQTDQVIPALSESNAAVRDTNALLKQMASEIRAKGV